MADGKKERDDHNSSCQRSPVPLFKTLGMKVFNLSKEHLDHQPQGSWVTGRTHLPYTDEYLWERYQLSRPGTAQCFFACGTFLYSVGDAEGLDRKPYA